jgi:hypothetical protein
MRLLPLDFHFNLSLAALNIINFQQILNDKALSINDLIRLTYNQRLLQNLLTQFSKKTDLEVFMKSFTDLFSSSAKWGEMI